MGALFFSVLLAVSSASPDDKRVHELLKSDNYSVTWGKPVAYDPCMELEIGDGHGHGFTLDWLRFTPTVGGVDVVTIHLDEGKEQYSSKWPPDRSKVVVKRARLETEAYRSLLQDLAVIHSASLKQIDRDSVNSSSNNFWVYTRLASQKQTSLDQQWSGYQSSLDEIHYAKPRAIVILAQEAVKKLDFKEHTLTAEERRWASSKFARDWKVIKNSEDYWWVRERYIMMIGVIGDSTTLPTLRDIMAGDPKERLVYYAINAISRLTGKDVRDKPVESMDVEKVRQKILEMIADGK
jgi:hypothetical protein